MRGSDGEGQKAQLFWIHKIKSWYNRSLNNHVSVCYSQIFYIDNQASRAARLRSERTTVKAHFSRLCSKYPMYEPSSFKLSKMKMYVPSTSDMSEIAACSVFYRWWSFSSHLLPSPTSSRSSISSSSCLFTRCQPLYASCCTYTSILFKVLYCKIKNVFFIFSVCALCVICVKSILNLLQYSTI